MAKAIGITVSAQWDRWERGFRGIGPEVARVAERRWLQATEVMFSASQEVVHVVTGHLKSTGHYSVSRRERGYRIRGDVEYDADYAIFEERRGGSHAFLHRAFEATERTYRDAMPEIWNELAASWRT